MRRNVIGWVVFLSAVSLTEVHAQTVHVKGYFDTDSAAVGQVIPYILTASYPRDKQVLFPDTTYSFAPFEPARKIFFPTRSTATTSYDSVVYFLSTFEIDSIQQLTLPVFVVQPKDCVAVYPASDSIRMRYRVTMPLDSISADKLPLKANTAYQRVKWIFNYPILLIATAVLIVAALVAWLVFGERIRKYFALRRMNRNYALFIRQFTGALDKLSANGSPRNAEEALLLWKSYMEGLVEYPFTKSTSREILRQFAHGGLGTALRTIDRGIYGSYGATPEPFQFLQLYSQEQFQKREAEVKNG
jgi:hypothetical protein